MRIPYFDCGQWQKGRHNFSIEFNGKPIKYQVEAVLRGKCSRLDVKLQTFCKPSGDILPAGGHKDGKPDGVLAETGQLIIMFSRHDFSNVLGRKSATSVSVLLFGVHRKRKDNNACSGIHFQERDMSSTSEVAGLVGKSAAQNFQIGQRQAGQNLPKTLQPHCK